MSKEHAIIFYKDKSGKEPVREFIEELSKKNTKDSLVLLHYFIKKTQKMLKKEILKQRKDIKSFRK